MKGSLHRKKLLGAWFEGREGPPVSEVELALYLDRRLNEAEREDVETRLALNPEMLQTLEVLAAVRDQGEAGLEAPSPALCRSPIRAFVLRQGPVEALRGALELVLEFASDCIRIVRETADEVRFYNQAQQLVRGDEDAVPGNLVLFWKNFEQARAEVEVERIEQNRNEVSLRITHPHSGTPVGGVRVHMYQGTALRESQVAGAGRAVFEDVAYGDYRFTLEKDESAIGHISLSMRGDVS